MILVKSIKHYFNIFRQVVKVYSTLLKQDAKALKTIKKVKRNSLDKKKIRIAFIVQMPEIWDKIKPVYEELNNRNIETVLIIVPQFDFKEKKIREYYGKELDYFSGISYNYIKAFDNGNWINIDFSKFNYVFYQRPYDGYLPQHLRSNIVFQTSKICYIPYCLWVFSLEYTADASNREFFENVFISFVETLEGKEYLQKHINFLDVFYIKNRIRHFYYYGYPQFQNIEVLPPKSLNTGMRILWTPRWTNGYAGGSNFLEYKDRIFDLNYNNNSIIIRPHPLMFDNFIEKKMISKREVEEYKKRLLNQNIYFDNNPLIEDTFKEIDLLITDISSVMMPYYLSGKPMIFCNHPEIEMCQMYRDLLPTMYVANNWEDVITIIERLRIEGDYMYEKRVETIKTYFTNFSRTSERIVDKLIELA